MDILHLVDRMEELFNNSKPIPFSHSVAVDENAFMDIIDQMRISIPEEIKKAQQVNVQKDRILAQAQEEAKRTVAIAQEKKDQMLEKSDIYASAQEKAEDITNQAMREAEETMRDADQYVADTLGSLKYELQRVLSQVENGIKALEPKDGV